MDLDTNAKLHETHASEHPTHEGKTVLRFILCGSRGQGKTTLLARLANGLGDDRKLSGAIDVVRAVFSATGRECIVDEI